MKTFEDLWKLNPNGSKEGAESYVHIYTNPANCIINGEGEIPTIDYLYNQYKSYLAWWKALFGNTKTEYLGKNRKKDLNTFLSDNSWKESYSKDVPSRDQYLFGEMDRKKMIDKTKQFIIDAGAK